MYGGREGHCRGGQSRRGPPKSRRRPPKGRPSAAAGRRGSAAPAKNFKIDSLAYNGLIRLLSRTHAQAVSLSVSLCHRPHELHRHLGTVGYNGDQRNGLGLVWIRSILGTGVKMFVGHSYQPRAFCPCARSTNLPAHAHRSV